MTGPSAQGGGPTNSAGIGSLFEQRAAKAHDCEGNLVGYFISADDWREVRATIDPALTVSYNAGYIAAATEAQS